MSNEPKYVQVAGRMRRVKDERRVKAETTDAEYLRDLAERLMRVPVMYGTDQGDVDRLREIATTLVALCDPLPDDGE